MTKLSFALAGCLACTLAASAADYTLHSFKKTTISKEFLCEGANFGDFNHDGKMDIEAGPYWFEGPDFTKRHEFAPPAEKPYDPHGYSDYFLSYVYDFNGDGWPDILVYSWPGKETAWYENPKNKDGHWLRHVIFAVTDNESPQLGDMNGDGKPELICHTEGYLGFAEADWSDPTKPWKFRRISPKGEWQRYTHGYGFGDINGDGRMDILEKDGWWEQPASLAGDPVWVKHPFNFGTGGAQMYVYDVNGDGLPDVITSLSAHGFGLAWYEQVRENGNITFRDSVNSGPGSSNLANHLLLFADGTDYQHQTLRASGTAPVCAAFYGPRTDAVLDATVDWVGSLSALSFRISGAGNGGIHYDESLATLGPVIGFRIARYVEDVRE